ncbi:MAG: glycosyltransferase [Acidobacteriota bacterium]|nr:glycosyltransferase [Acidobacteriota bacterium]
MNPIPRIMHFIWIGGPLPQKNQDCIRSFARSCHDWDIWLWIDMDNLLTSFRRSTVRDYYGKGDKKTIPVEKLEKVAKKMGVTGGDAETAKYLSKKFGVSGGELGEKAGDAWLQLSQFCRANTIRLKLTEEFSEVSSYKLYRQEMVARNTNFGAASDILRIQILLKYGGVYLDTDVVANGPLGQINAHADSPRWSAVDSRLSGKGVHISQRDWDDDNWWKTNMKDFPSICNSIIASHPNCEALNKYKKIIKSNYAALAKKDAKALRREYMTDFRGSTIRTTGPSAATKAQAFDQYRDDQWANTIGPDMEANEAARLKAILWCRDNLYFPMYLVSDQFFHDWL